VVEGEVVQIAHRHDQTALASAGVGDEVSAVRSAWLTRSYEGHVRQRALQHLLRDVQPWMVPFIVQLCGEYVIEIG
jgi:hypothetical protein